MDGCRKKKVLSSFLVQDKIDLKQALAKKGIDLHLRSGICLEILNAKFPKANWLFIQSPKTVKLLATIPGYQTLLTGYKIGVIGPSTEKELNKIGFPAIFIGKGISTENDILSFLNVLGDTELVCVLSGDKSLNRVLEALPKKQVLAHKFYKNKQLDVSGLEDFTLVHYSSPSQVEAFYASKNIKKDSQKIAIGKSTSDILIQLGFKSILQKDYHNKSLYEEIIKQLN